MSGNWVQRGEPALIDKWARTKMALYGGADVVLELPASFAFQSAENFALGAIRSLNDTGAVTHLCFGSELGDINPLHKIASLLADEPLELKELIKERLGKGLSYPSALAKSVDLFLNDTMVSQVINKPNNILGIEYLKSLIKINSSIIPFTILREGTGYHSLELEGEIASATAIRRGIKENIIQKIAPTLPSSSMNILIKEIDAGRGPIFYDNLDISILTLLRRATLRELYLLPDMENGLPERFYKACRSKNTINEIIKEVKTKRYTTPRLQRILVYLLLGISKSNIKIFTEHGPKYLRVLGFSSRGQEILHLIKKNSQLPLVTSPSKYFRHCQDKIGHKMLALDIKASDMYTLFYQNHSFRIAGQDFRTPPIKI